MRHAPFLIALCSLAACAGADDTSKDTDEVPTDAIDDDVDTDVADTDVADTDDTDTLDTADSGAGPLFASVPFVHAGIYPLNSRLRFRDLVVTAVRYRASPPASNGIVVQDPTKADNAGLYVDLDNTPQSQLPAIGDEVAFTGLYIEDPVGGTGTNALSVVVVDPADPRASLSITGATDLPEPVVLTLATLLVPASAEPYESMRIRVDGPLTVTTEPNSFGDVKVKVGATEATLSARFYDLRTGYSGLGTSDTMTSLSGVLFWEGTSYKIATTVRADAAGFVDR